jgi:hypothetical protein
MVSPRMRAVAYAIALLMDETMRANVYLHFVLDLMFQKVVIPQ